MGAPQQALLTGGAVSATAGALDSFSTNLWAAYGITRQRSSSVYSGSAIRVRKSTGGDQVSELDIGFVGSVLNTSDLATFAGSETVVVTKLYDQSGNGRDLVQATGANQPRITAAGVYDGFVRFDASNDELLTTATTGTGTVLSTSSKCTHRSATPTQVVYAVGTGAGGNSIAQVYIPNGNFIDTYTGGSTGSPSDRKNAQVFASATTVYGHMHNLTGGSDALCSRMWIGGLEQTTTNSSGTPTGNLTAQTLRLGSGGGANYCAVNVYSFAVWEANQASNFASIATAMA